jgi:uncharacterized protein
MTVRDAHGAVMRASVSLGAALGERGLPACADQAVLLCHALGEVDVRQRAQVYWSARSVFVRSPEHVPAFEEVFDRFWAGEPLFAGTPMVAAGESDPRMPGAQHGGESTPQFRMDGRSSHLVDGEPTRATREIPAAPGEDPQRPLERARRGLLAAYSPEEVLPEADAWRWEREELAAVKRLAQELRRAAPQRRSRRARRARLGGRLDLRRTLQQAMRTDGEALELAFCATARRPRNIVVICDVSGSMERYSRALLAALGGIVGSGVRAEAFVFATRLTRVTGQLAGHDSAACLERARAAVADWSGGTRIGDALRDFNRTWGRRGIARGAVVLIVSDGWDRGDPGRLAIEVARLRLQSRRLVWLNPRPAQIDGQPLALGMRAALPHVDDFVPGHDPRAVAALAKLIGGLGSGRPARAQRVSVRAETA